MSQNGETEDLEQTQPQDISLAARPKNRLDNPTADATVLCGQQAWQRLRREQTWDDWKYVGEAHLMGRSRAMYEASVNRPVGRRYQAAFAAWLKKFGFDNLDKADRSRLFAVMDHLHEIETWRTTLTPTERLRLNHPSAILRKWRSAISPRRTSGLSPSKRWREETSALKQEIVRLSQHRVAGERWDPADRPEAIATAMVAKLSRNKAAAVAGAILKALDGQIADRACATDESDQEVPNIGAEDAT